MSSLLGSLVAVSITFLGHSPAGLPLVLSDLPSPPPAMVAFAEVREARVCVSNGRGAEIAYQSWRSTLAAVDLRLVRSCHEPDATIIADLVPPDFGCEPPVTGCSNIETGVAYCGRDLPPRAGSNEPLNTSTCRHELGHLLGLGHPVRQQSSGVCALVPTTMDRAKCPRDGPFAWEALLIAEMADRLRASRGAPGG